MTQWKDDLSDGNEPELEGDDDYEQMRELLHAHLSEFAEEHDLPNAALSALLLDLAVTERMMDYVLSVEKPSASGLKLELDRMQRDVADFVRDCKRNADEFISHSKDAVAQARAELEAESEREEASTSRAASLEDQVLKSKS
jgi:hypothetical protein